MHTTKKEQKTEKIAMSASMYANLIFVVIELIMAVVTRSQSVLLDAVYDGVESVMMLPYVLLIPFLYKPSNDKLPFGYLQIETLLIVIKGLTMSAATVGIIVSNIELLLHGGRSISFDMVAVFEFFAFVLGLVVYIFLYTKNRRLNSPLITAEMDGWKIDCLVSLGMAAAFLIPRIFNVGMLRLYLDQIIAIILSFVMLPIPLKTVVTGLRDLILIPPEAETIGEIKHIVEDNLIKYGYSRMRHEIVRTGRKLWISTYISPEADEMSIKRFKEAQTACIEALAKKYTDFYFELLPMIEFDEAEIRISKDTAADVN